jgi:steroid 5-alpha reductase family enzyme
MSALLGAAVALWAFMTLLYLIATVARNNGIADVGYGVAFMVVIGTVLWFAPGTSVWLTIIGTLPFIWGARLAARIAKKNFGRPEDFRYKAWRDAWGSTFWWRSYLQVYMLQGLVIFVVASPVVLSLVYPASLPVMPLVYLGLLVWCVGIFFEVVGDAQLDRFVGDKANRGKIMMSGLWYYSRHPNYFGEASMWWGIALMAAGLSALPLIGFLSPLLITYLLRYVSGVPMLEARWVGNSEWEAYKARTSVLVPWPPTNTPHGAA